MLDPTMEGSGVAWSTAEQIGYCSIADLERKIGKQKLAELTNDAFTQGKSNEGAEPNVEVCNALIAEADQEIDSFVGMRYAVPFALASIPEYIKYLSVNITSYKAFRRKLPANEIVKAWTVTHDECTESLKKIGSGEMEIGEDANQAQGIISVAQAKQTQFYNSDYQISRF